jgi:hypothetical protein
MITAEQLREHVHYDPETGVFTRIKWTGSRGLIGADLGYLRKDGYLSFQLCKVTQLSHRWAWLYVTGDLPEKPLEVDHINRVRTDNRWENLRLVTNQHNKFNTDARGYCWNQDRQKWMAYIQVDERMRYLGLHQTEEEARAAYLAAKAELHVIEEVRP